MAEQVQALAASLPFDLIERGNSDYDRDVVVSWLTAFRRRRAEAERQRSCEKRTLGNTAN
ncbi:hypothetical protein HNP60_000728 [Sphingobium sp. B1D3A]|uniref:Uncharacterized protein n=1 Tax=Sphingobium lignivorans TaxID=2735886 RepID=A0ABR6NBT8_9SPHN|nr:hypothetical protein [Sphingobium lignivorans]